MDIPKEFGDFVIEGPLGQGGMGVVYKALQKTLQRKVAIKLLPAAYDEELQKRFLLEAQTSAKLNHPNIVQIYTMGRVNKIPYFAMEYIEGYSMIEVVKRHKELKFYRMIDMLCQVGEALHFAHEQGIVHRDIKPGNVMVTKRRFVKVMDFGLAKVKSQMASLTQTGVILGTPYYMAPEQATGGEIDGRADIYALGIIAYQMVTGQFPFQGDNPNILIYKHIYDLPQPPDQLCGNLPGNFAEIILKCLKKKPEERFANAGELVTALKAMPKSRDKPLLPGEMSQQKTITQPLQAPHTSVQGSAPIPIQSAQEPPPPEQKDTPKTEEQPREKKREKQNDLMAILVEEYTDDEEDPLPSRTADVLADEFSPGGFEDSASLDSSRRKKTSSSQPLVQSLVEDEWNAPGPSNYGFDPTKRETSVFDTADLNQVYQASNRKAVSKRIQGRKKKERRTLIRISLGLLALVLVFVFYILPREKELFRKKISRNFLQTVVEPFDIMVDGRPLEKGVARVKNGEKGGTSRISMRVDGRFATKSTLEIRLGSHSFTAHWREDQERFVAVISPPLEETLKTYTVEIVQSFPGQAYLLKDVRQDGSKTIFQKRTTFTLKVYPQQSLVLEQPQANPFCSHEEGLTLRILGPPSAKVFIKIGSSPPITISFDRRGKISRRLALKKYKSGIYPLQFSCPQAGMTLQRKILIFHEFAPMTLVQKNKISKEKYGTIFLKKAKVILVHQDQTFENQTDSQGRIKIPKKSEDKPLLIHWRGISYTVAPPISPQYVLPVVGIDLTVQNGQGTPLPYQKIDLRNQGKFLRTLGSTDKEGKIWCPLSEGTYQLSFEGQGLRGETKAFSIRLSRPNYPPTVIQPLPKFQPSYFGNSLYLELSLGFFSRNLIVLYFLGLIFFILIAYKIFKGHDDSL